VSRGKLAGLHLADCALQSGPGGIVHARVVVGHGERIAGRVVRRGKDGIGMQRLASYGASESGTNDLGGVMHRVA
jgi:hypothetical protein